MQRHTARQHSDATPRTWPVWLASALMLGALGSCGGGGGSSNKTSTNTTGEIVDHPDGSGAFIVDQNQAGNAQEVRILRQMWGRLVQVFGVDAVGLRVPMQSNFVITGTLESDGQNYVIDTNAVTAQQTLTIMRDVTDLTPGGGLEQFYDLLVQSEANLSPIFDANPNSAAIFSMVPRNAAIVIQFDDLIDEDTLDETTVRAVTGVPQTIPFEGRTFIDRNHGDLADHDGGGGDEFYSTRVIIDTTITEVESFEFDPPLPVNGVGLPPSIDVNLSNLMLRIPTVTNQTFGQTEVLQNPSGHFLTTVNNGNVDLSSPTRDVIRAMRSGGSVTADDYNGFLPDDIPPQVVGSNPMFINFPPVSLNNDDEFLLPEIEFASEVCAQTPSIGDVINQPGVFAEVIEIPAPELNGKVNDVKVRLILYPALWDLPGQDAALEWIDNAVGEAAFLAAFDPVDDVDRVECFAQVFPTPTGFPAQPNVGLFTSSTIGARFSEPMDPASLTAFDSMTLSRVPVNPGNDPPLSTSDYVVGSVTQTLDLQEFTFVPDLPLAHVTGTAEDYFLSLNTGSLGPTDLAGNGLAFALPQIEVRTDAAAATQRNGGRVSRFTGQDEEPPIGDELTGPIPEWAGQHLYNLQQQLIRPRPVTRQLAIADRTQPVPALMTPFALGVQTPLSGLGSKLQHVWRYVDFGFSLTDVSTYNMDVEGLSWSPIGGQVVADQFTEFEIRLAHSKWAPDEYIDPGSLFPKWQNSGLRPTYTDNILEPSEAPQKVMHPKFMGYGVNPGDLYTASTGTKFLPFPLNRTIPEEDWDFYTWRDTSIQARAGSGSGGVDPDQLFVALGLTPPPNDYMSAGNIATIGLPLLMEYRCYPDDGAAGVNSFDISLSVNTSSRPYFRAFSTGGTNTSNNTVYIDPDLEAMSNGGFNPISSPTPGAATYGRDNSFYIGALDLVTRVSRTFSIWFVADDPTTGTPFANPVYNPPIMEPGASDQPLGTQIRLAFRGASNVDDTPEGIQAKTDATWIDNYGDHYDDSMIIPPAVPNHNPNQANKGVVFATGDETWKSDVTTLDGAVYYQIRVTFISNVLTGLNARLSAVALSWRE